MLPKSKSGNPLAVNNFMVVCEYIMKSYTKSQDKKILINNNYNNYNIEFIVLQIRTNEKVMR